MEQGSTSLSTSTSHGNECGDHVLQPKYKVFLSHSGAQKGFVEQLWVDLERCDRCSFFDKCRDCLPIGKPFPRRILEAIEECEVGVVVLSEEFFTSKWPMLELVAMANVQKRNPSYTIMPIFLGITFSQCRDPKKHEEWLSLWQTWADKDDRIDVKDWENALQLFGPTNALKYNLELGEVKFREEIVEAICALVPPGTRFEDSHIQGRSRLCKVIHDTIKESKLSLLYGVHIVGIYGVGGIGKTTICKAMCNDLSKEYRNKVAYVELGSRNEEELWKEVLRKLTDKNLERLGAMNLDQYQHHLKSDMMNAKVFLAIDNVSSATTNQALTLLRAGYRPRSVVVVTARSLNELTALRIDASDCMEMPELEMEEARSLFLDRASCVPTTYLSNKEDHKLISSCVERCHFKKGVDISRHYHPLALQVLGEQLGCVGYDRDRWWSLLDELDFLNLFGEVKHPVFSILRRSFVALNPQDQLLFMDVALFVPYNGLYTRRCLFKWNIFEWLGMVHGIPIKSVMERLENLKRKSVLENLGDGFGRIGMHDLWREFARLETKVGEFEKKLWMFEWDEYNALEEGILTNGGGLLNVRRMFFLNKGFVKLEEVNFSCFPKVVILKLKTGVDVDLNLDLRGLKQLKSLELEWSEFTSRKSPTLIGLGTLLKLGFLRWCDIPSNSPSIDEIGCLTNLRVLDLYQCGRLPDLSNLVFLQMVCFHGNASVVTLTGLSSKHTNLQFLDLSDCHKLQRCPGLGELVSLQELRLYSCYKLKEVPNLKKLKRLQKLDVNNCYSLTGLPGLGDLVSLLKLHAFGCWDLVELPNMCNLRNLRELNLSHCTRIKSLPGLDELICLQSLRVPGCKNLIQLPDMHKLTNLHTLELDQNLSPQASTGWSDLISLQNLDVRFDELHDWRSLCKLTKLETLRISGLPGRGSLSVAELVSLESLTITNCKGVCVLPDLKRLSRLRYLNIWKCEFEDLSGLINLTNLKELEVSDCDQLDALPDLQELAKLEKLRVHGGARLRDVRGIFGLRNLKWLQLSGHPWLHESLSSDLLLGLEMLDVSDDGFEDLQWLTACSKLWSLECRSCPIQELPDLSNFPNLVGLYVSNCVNLTKLTCTGPLSSEFQNLDVSGCMRLQAVPDLTNSRKMRFLDVSNSGVLLNPQLVQDLEVPWTSVDLVPQDTRGSSHGFWRYCLGMIASLTCGCIGTSSEVSPSSGVFTTSFIIPSVESDDLWNHRS